MNYFFKDGIKFQCQKCGHCCIGDTGSVYVTHKDINAIARTLKLKSHALTKQYLYPFRDSYSIKERPDGRCVFYEDGCKIYPVRPSQCRTYPFWLKNLRNETNWKKVRKECPGVGQGKLYSEEEILEIINLSAL